LTLPVETLKSVPPWKSCLECEWRVCVSSTDALVIIIITICYTIATLRLFYQTFKINRQQQQQR